MIVWKTDIAMSFTSFNRKHNGDQKQTQEKVEHVLFLPSFCSVWTGWDARIPATAVRAFKQCSLNVCLLTNALLKLSNSEFEIALLLASASSNLPTDADPCALAEYWRLDHHAYGKAKRPTEEELTGRLLHLTIL